MPSDRQRRRDELARAEGFPSFHAKREAQARAQGYPSFRARRAARDARSISPADAGAAPGRRQILPLADGELVETTKHGKGRLLLVGRIEKAAKRGDRRVSMSVGIRDGKGPLQVADLWAHGGIDAGDLWDTIEAFGGGVTGLEAAIWEQLGRQYQSAPVGEIVSISMEIS